MDGQARVLQIAEKVRTPLILSGLVVIVLYFLFRQVLELDVFENIGSANTFALLTSVLNLVFWLALVSIVLGVGGYIVERVLKHQIDVRSSNVTLIDASLDPNDSEYEQAVTQGKTTIQPKPPAKK